MSEWKLTIETTTPERQATPAQSQAWNERDGQDGRGRSDERLDCGDTEAEDNDNQPP